MAGLGSMIYHGAMGSTAFWRAGFSALKTPWWADEVPAVCKRHWLKMAISFAVAFASITILIYSCEGGF